MTRIRMPGNLQVPTKFFGQFTPKDLVRVSLPGLLVFITQYNTASATNMLWLLPAILVGGFWYVWRPYGQPLDKHLYHLLRWVTFRNQLDSNAVKDVDHDHILTKNGSAIALIEVQPTNLEMRTSTEQKAIHSVYQTLLHSVNYPVEIHSQQEPLDLNDYIQYLEETESKHRLLKKDYLRYCNELANSQFKHTRHFITLRVNQRASTQLPDWLPFTEEESLEERSMLGELDSRVHEVLDLFNTAELTADRITDRDLYNIGRELLKPVPNTGWNWTAKPKHKHGDYRKTVAITEYPSTVELGWTTQLLRTNGLVDVTQVIQPRNPGKTSKKLQRLAEKLNAEIDSFLSQGYRGTNKLEGLLDDTEWLLNLLADREDQPVDYSTYITVHDQDQQRCIQGFDQVCNRLQTLQIEYEEPVFQTDQAFQTQSPLHPDRLDTRMLMPAGSAAAGFPFGTQSINKANGVIYGVDTSDRTPILLNRFDWSSHSTARMGMVGSGKSYATKQEILRTHLVYSDIQIYIVDPKKEYNRITRSLNGTSHILTSKTEVNSKLFEDNVLCFEVEERGNRDNPELLVELLEELYNQVSQNRRPTLVVIDEARILMNHEEGRQLLNQFVLEGRDTNTAVTLVTQNASHFTYCREGREILDNMPGKFFMRHDRVPDSVVDYFDLSQREKQALFELKTGTDSEYSEALVKVSGKLDTKIKVESTSAEHAIIEQGKRRVTV